MLPAAAPRIPSGVIQTNTAPGLIHSSVLAHVPHAFTTRLGGVSSGPFASLNFGNPGELAQADRDPIANIRANYARVTGAIGCEGRQLVEVHQVHGAAAHLVRRGEPAHPTPHDTRADAIVTDDPTRALAVRIADCAPVLIASRDGRVVGAVHAGWRGVVAGVVGAAIDAMRELRPECCAGGLVAAVGPCISGSRFEVGPEVAMEFTRVFGTTTPHIRSHREDRYLADLKGAIAEQLAAAGVGIGAVEILPHCTYADARLFFSHRRAMHERALTGRHAAVIAPRA